MTTETNPILASTEMLTVTRRGDRVEFHLPRLPFPCRSEFDSYDDYLDAGRERLDEIQRRGPLQSEVADETEGWTVEDLCRKAADEYHLHVTYLADGQEERAYRSAVRADLCTHQAQRTAERARIAAEATTPEQFAELPEDVRWFINQMGDRHLEVCGEGDECSMCVLLGNAEQHKQAQR